MIPVLGTELVGDEGVENAQDVEVSLVPAGCVVADVVGVVTKMGGV